MEITGAWANLEIFGRHCLKIMVEDIRLGRDGHLKRSLFAQKVRSQDFDRGIWARRTDGRDHRREMPCPAVVKIIAINGGDHRMGEPQLLYRLGDAGGLKGIERAGQARPDIAEGAGPRANVAHDHKGRVFFLPALANVRTARFLADRHQPMFPDDFLRRGPLRRAGCLDPDPFRLARHRLIRRSQTMRQ